MSSQHFCIEKTYLRPTQHQNEYQTDECIDICGPWMTGDRACTWLQLPHWEHLPAFPVTSLTRSCAPCRSEGRCWIDPSLWRHNPWPDIGTGKSLERRTRVCVWSEPWTDVVSVLWGLWIWLSRSCSRRSEENCCPGIRWDLWISWKQSWLRPVLRTAHWGFVLQANFLKSSLHWI